MSKYDNLLKKNRNLKLAWGVECGEGWFDIIEKCTTNIAAISRRAGCKPPVVVQIKEKFGGLRYYIQGCNEKVHDGVYAEINKAESDSYQTCEVCGEPGSVRKGSWVATRCDEHADPEEDIT